MHHQFCECADCTNERRQMPIRFNPNRFNFAAHDHARALLDYSFDYYVARSFSSHERVAAEIAHDRTDADLMLMLMRVRPHYDAKRAAWKAYNWSGLAPFHEWAAGWGPGICKEADTLHELGKKTDVLPIRGKRL